MQNYIKLECEISRILLQDVSDISSSNGFIWMLSFKAQFKIQFFWHKVGKKKNKLGTTSACALIKDSNYSSKKYGQWFQSSENNFLPDTLNSLKFTEKKAK